MIDIFSTRIDVAYPGKRFENIASDVDRLVLQYPQSKVTWLQSSDTIRTIILTAIVEHD